MDGSSRRFAPLKNSIKNRYLGSSPTLSCYIIGSLDSPPPDNRRSHWRKVVHTSSIICVLCMYIAIYTWIFGRTLSGNSLFTFDLHSPFLIYTSLVESDYHSFRFSPMMPMSTSMSPTCFSPGRFPMIYIYIPGPTHRLNVPIAAPEGPEGRLRRGDASSLLDF